MRADPPAQRRGPDLEPGSTQSSLVPYGPGAPIEVSSLGKPVTVYVVKWTDTASDEDFRRIGLTPLTFQLPEGTYLLEVEGPGVTQGSRMLEVRGPKRLVVNTGSDGIGTAGGLFIGLGSVAILTGIVMLAGRATSSETGIETPGVAVPLLAGGAGVLGTGIAFYLLSRTDVDEQGASTRTTMGGLRGSF